MTTHNIQNNFELCTDLHEQAAVNKYRQVNDGQGFLAGMIRKLQAALVNSLQNQLKAHEERRAIEHLRAMNDDQLRDLGITRADITRVVQYGKEAL